MSDSVFSKKQRLYPSLWEASRKFGRLHLVDLASLPHSIGLLQVFQEVLVLLQLLTLMSSKLEPLRGSNSRIHRYVFASLHGKLFVTSFDSEPGRAIPWLLLLAVLASVKFAAAFLVFRQSQLQQLQRGQLLTQGLRYFTAGLYARLTLLFVPHAAICVAIFRLPASFLYSLAAVLLLATPLELLVHHVLTYDYRFRRINALQGESYSLFLLKNALFFAVIVAESLLRSQKDTRWAIALVFAMHFLVGCSVFGFLLKHQVYKGRLICIGRVLGLLYLVYAIEAAFCLLQLVWPAGLAGYDLDLLLCLALCLARVLSQRYSELQNHSLLYSSFDASKGSPGLAKKYIEYLVDLYEGQRDSLKSKNALLLNVTLHMQACCNPLCLCFKLRLFHQRDLGSSFATFASNLHSHYHGSDSIENNFFSTFNDKDLLAEIRQETASFVKVCGTAAKKTELTLASLKDARPSAVDCKVDLSSRIAFQQFVCSLYTCCFEFGSSVDLFELAKSYCSFLVFEYANPLAALVFSYNYAYSARYKRYSSFLRHVYLHNFIDIAKQSFSDESLSKTVDSASTAIRISEVVSFKIRVDELKARVKELIQEKADFYSLIVDSQIDFKELISRSTSLYAGIRQVERDLAPLLQAKSENLRLIRTALDLEIRLKERQKVSLSIRNSFKEALLITKNKISFNLNLLAKNRFNPLSSENSVALARKEQGTFRIAYFTTSCVELFGLPRSSADLAGKKLVEFMPSTIAPVHDKMVVNYLNGNSSFRFGGRFNTSVLGKDGVPRSVFIFPKIECRFTDEVLVGAIISPRKKNSLPLLLTDEPGKILGSNPLFQGVLPRGCQAGEFGLFTMFPRLFEVFHADSWEGYRCKRRGLSAGPEDALSEDSQQDESPKQVPSFVRTSVKNGSLDLFVFPMLCTGILAKQAQSRRTVELQCKKARSRSSFNWRRLRSVLLSENSAYFSVKALKKYFLQHKSQVVFEAKKVLRSRVNVETHRYQHGIVLREVSVEYYLPSEKYVQQFVATSLKKHGYSVFDVLTLKPESVVDLFSLATLLRSVAQHSGRDTPQALLRKIVTCMIEAQDRSPRPDKRSSKQLTKTSLAVQLERVESKSKKPAPVKASETFVDDITAEPVVAGSVRSNFFHPSSSKQSNNLVAVFSKPRAGAGKSDLEGDHSGSNQIPDSSKWLQGHASFHRFLVDAFEGSHADDTLQKLSNKLFEIFRYLSEELTGTQIASMGELAIDLLLRSEDRSSKKSARKIAKNLGSTRHVIAGLSKMEIPNDSRAESISKDRTKTKSHRSRSRSDSYYADKEESLGDGNNSDVYLNSELGFGRASQANSNGSLRHHQATSQHDAEQVRQVIENNRTAFKHFWWEVALLLVTAGLLGGKLVCKAVFHQKFTDVAVHGELANKYSRMLRPLGFVYKESAKCSAFLAMRGDAVAPGFLAGFFSGKQVCELQQRMKSDIRLVFNSFESTREVNFELHPAVSSATSHTMAYYALCVHLELLFGRFVRELESHALADAASLCQQMEQLATHMLAQFLAVYEEILQAEKKNLAGLRKNFLLVCGFGFVAILPFALLLSQTYDAVHSQIKFEASLLVLIEKSKIDLAVQKLLAGKSKSQPVVRKETAKQSSKTGSQIEVSQPAIAATKFTRLQVFPSTALNHVDPFRKMPIRQSIGKKEQRVSVVLNHPIASVKKPTNSKILNLPQRSAFRRFIWSLVILLVLGLPISVDILVQFSLILESEGSFQGLSDGNRIGSSILVLAATNYKLRQAGSSLVSPFLLQLDKKMLGFLHLLPTMGSQPLQKLFKKVRLCQAVEKEFDASQAAVCEGHLSDSSDQTIFRVLNDFSFQSDAVRRSLDKGELLGSDLQFFQQPEFRKNDDLSIFLALTIKRLCTDFKDSLMAFVATAVRRSKALTYVDLAVWSSFLLVCKICLLRKSQKALVGLRKAFLLMNDDLLTTMYLKSYFMRGQT